METNLQKYDREEYQALYDKLRSERQRSEYSEEKK